MATVGRIPVRNLWLLMLYASRLYRALSISHRYAAEENPDEIPDMVAEILTRAVERRLPSQPEFRIRPAGGGPDPRARPHQRPAHGTAATCCSRGGSPARSTELTTDTPRNRYVRAALNHLNRTVNRIELRRRCRIIASALERAGVGTGTPCATGRGVARSPVSAGKSNAEDRQMLAAAELAFNLRLPTEAPGQSRLPAPARDERWARMLFEAGRGRLLRYRALTPGMGRADGQRDELADRISYQRDFTDSAQNANRHRPGKSGVG